MDNLALAPITMCFTKAVLSAGSTTTITQTLAGGATSNIIAIRGKMYTVAALSNTASPTTDWATGAAFNQVLKNNGCVYMIGFDHSGNLRAIQGQVTALDTITVPGNFLLAPQFGSMGPSGSGTTDQDFCPVGYMVVKADSTASATSGWLLGTSNTASPPTGVTLTFVDVCGMVDRPQVA